MLCAKREKSLRIRSPKFEPQISVVALPEASGPIRLRPSGPDGQKNNGPTYCVTPGRHVRRRRSMNPNYSRFAVFLLVVLELWSSWHFCVKRDYSPSNSSNWARLLASSVTTRMSPGFTRPQRALREDISLRRTGSPSALNFLMPSARMLAAALTSRS